VVVICGETGSGKTTQLPKICLEIGRGLNGLIGHTQPRRIAARATATRIAQELKSELGRHVGFKIRFTDKVTPSSYIKLMTDGILLAETQTDPLLRQYDTILIDEAHERSLNIDFLLGYLKQLLPKRRDLKLIVTSATLDAERFSKHFETASPGDRGFRPPVSDRDDASAPGEGRRTGRDLNDAIVDAVDEAHRTGPGRRAGVPARRARDPRGGRGLRKHHPPGLEVLPLFARQTAAGAGARLRLAPGSPRGAGDQRRRDLADRARHPLRDRLGPGAGQALLASQQGRAIAGRADLARGGQPARRALRPGFGRRLLQALRRGGFQQAPAYTEPEILRSSLAGVILRMKSLHLGDVEDFPFLEAPAPRMIADGYQLLAELGAIDETTKEWR
jgi:ATP-dependent helicase HrpA